MKDLLFFLLAERAVVVVIVWELDWQLSMQLIPITAEVASLIPAHGEVYSIQHYMIKVVSDLWQVGGFSPVSSNNNTDRHNIAEIILNVVLSTITLTLYVAHGFQEIPQIMKNEKKKKKML